MRKNWRKGMLCMVGGVLCFLSACCLVAFTIYIRPIDMTAVPYFLIVLGGLATGIWILTVAKRVVFVYNGFQGTCEYSKDDKVYHGAIADIGDLVTYEAEKYCDLEQAFQEAVDDYIAFLKDVAPEKLTEKCG